METLIIFITYFNKKINEKNVYEQLPMLLKEFKPDIVVITGHDAYYRKKGR